MSVQKKYFDKTTGESLAQPDFNRVVNYDDAGVEYITYVPVDYEELQTSNGTVDLWSIDSLLKAGINPDFPVRTGFNSRIEGVNIIGEIGATATDILKENEDTNK